MRLHTRLAPADDNDAVLTIKRRGHAAIVLLPHEPAKPGEYPGHFLTTLEFIRSWSPLAASRSLLWGACQRTYQSRSTIQPPLPSNSRRQPPRLSPRRQVSNVTTSRSPSAADGVRQPRCSARRSRPSRPTKCPGSRSQTFRATRARCARSALPTASTRWSSPRAPTTTKARVCAGSCTPCAPPPPPAPRS